MASAFPEEGWIGVTPNYFTLPEATRRAVLYHEGGHFLETAWMVDDDAMIDEVTPARVSFGHLNGQTTPSEIAAEAFSILWDEPAFLSEHAPGVGARVIEAATVRGFPLPEGLDRFDWTDRVWRHEDVPAEDSNVRVYRRMIAQMREAGNDAEAARITGQMDAYIERLAPGADITPPAPGRATERAVVPSAVPAPVRSAVVPDAVTAKELLRPAIAVGESGGATYVNYDEPYEGLGLAAKDWANNGRAIRGAAEHLIGPTPWQDTPEASTDPDARRHAENLLYAMSAGEEWPTLWRGITLDGDTAARFEAWATAATTTGSTIDLALAGFSGDEVEARGFSRSGPRRSAVMFRTNGLTKGLSAAKAQQSYDDDDEPRRPLSWTDVNEAEVITGGRYRVLGVKQDADGRWVVDIEQSHFATTGALVDMVGADDLTFSMNKATGDAARPFKAWDLARIFDRSRRLDPEGMDPAEDQSFPAPAAD